MRIEANERAIREREEIERNLREEEKAMEEAMREKQEKEDKKSLIDLQNVFGGAGAKKDVREQNIKTCIRMLLEDSRF